MDQRMRAASADRAPGVTVGPGRGAPGASASGSSLAPEAEALLQLQRLAGNRAVAGAVGHRPTVQRWAVGFNAASEDCVAAANWITGHTPHPRGAWARTFVTFTRAGTVQVSGTGTDLTATVASPAVTHTKRVDMPTWSPTAPSMAAAWSRASGELRTHEGVHEQRGDEWRTELESRLTSFSEPVRSRAAGEAELNRQWTQWVADHQADQNLLDPFSVALDCSDTGGSEDATEDAAGPDLSGELSLDEDAAP
jgi:hypothetical protein